MKIKIKNLSDKEIDKKKIKSWPIWEKEVSRFDWHYDETEQCLIIEGKALIETDDGKVEIKEGDFVEFPKGLSCIWDVKKDIKKYYNFK